MFHVQRRSGLRHLVVEDAEVEIAAGQLQAHAYSVAIAPDGKIVLAGNVVKADGGEDFAVARFNDDLTLDATFNGRGAQFSDFQSNADGARAVAVQDDLKIVVAGYALISGTIYTDYDFAVERFNEDGTLDTTFDGDGKWTYDAGSDADYANALAIQTDGKIVVAGGATPSIGCTDFMVVRLNSNGSYDSSFDGDGKASAGFGFCEGAQAVAVDPSNGSITLAGGDFGEHKHILVVRFLANGTLDSSFGGNEYGGAGGGPGTLIAPIIDKGTAYAVVVQPDHKTVVAGRALTLGYPDRFILMRFMPDGSFDPTFNGNGKVFTPFQTGTGAAGLAMQSDGSFVVTGGTQLARYRSDGSLDAGGVVDIVFDPAHTGSEATAVAIDTAGKLVSAGKVYRTDYDVAVARYEADYAGGLDPTFGTDFPQTGRSLFGITGSLETRAMAIRSDDKIVTVGDLYFNDFNFLVARFNANGTADPSCSGSGLATVDYGVGDDSATAVLTFGDKTYVGGTVRGPTNNDFGFLRLNDACAIDDTGGAVSGDYKFRFDLGGDDSLAAMLFQQGFGFVLAGTSSGNAVVVRTRQNIVSGNVTLDANFGTGGQTVLDLGNGETVTGLGRQSDGKFIVSGTADSGAGPSFFVARLRTDGLLDDTFGDTGVTFVSFNFTNNARALAIRDDDTIAIVGCTTTTRGEVFAVAQLTADGFLDSGFSSDGQATLRTGPSGEECAQAATFLDSDRLVVGGYSSIFGVRNFILAAFETNPTPTTTTTTTTNTTMPTTSTTTTPSSVCGDVTGDEAITASDALAVLRGAVGLGVCEPCICDADGSGTVAATDALLVLRVAVGQTAALECPAC